MTFRIGSREVGPGQPCFIIGEVGLAHDGSLSQAHAYIDAIAKAGADAAKFQCHLGDPVSEWRVKIISPYAKLENRSQYWERTGFNPSEWQGLRDHCQNVGLEFLCSVFSLEGLAVIDPWVNAHKVPSGRIADIPLLEAIGKTRKPVLLSSGMCTRVQVAEAQRVMLGYGPVKLLQCTSAYPCPPESVGLDELEYWAEGLSDHSGTIYPGIAAAALGCQVLEVHVCWSKDQGGFDTAASITSAQLGQLVEGVRFVEKAMRPVDKDALAEQLAETRRVFMGVPEKAHCPACGSPIIDALMHSHWCSGRHEAEMKA